MIILTLETKPLKTCCRIKDFKKVQMLKADFTRSRVSADDIFSRFQVLKPSGALSEFKEI
jgi:hypothetical protein